MLTKEEREKIVEEEMLRMKVRQEAYARTGCLAMIGRILLFMVLMGSAFWAIMITASIFHLGQSNPDLTPYVLGALPISILVATILFRKIFRKK